MVGPTDDDDHADLLAHQGRDSNAPLEGSVEQVPRPEPIRVVGGGYWRSREPRSYRLHRAYINDGDSRVDPPPNKKIRVRPSK